MTKIAVIAYEGLRARIEPRNIQIIDSIPLDVQQCHAWVYFKESWTWTLSWKRLLKIFSSRFFTVTVIARRLFTHDSMCDVTLLSLFQTELKFAYAHRFVPINLFLKTVKKLLDASASTLAAVHSKGIEVEASKIHYIPFPGFFPYPWLTTRVLLLTSWVTSNRSGGYKNRIHFSHVPRSVPKSGQRTFAFNSGTPSQLFQKWKEKLWDNRK